MFQEDVLLIVEQYGESTHGGKQAWEMNGRLD